MNTMVDRLFKKWQNGVITERQFLANMVLNDMHENLSRDKRLTEESVIVESPEDIVIRKEAEREQVELIKKLMSNLTLLEKECIWLSLAEGMSVRQISATLGIPKSTVQRILDKAKEKLDQETPKYEQDKNYALEKFIDINGHYSCTILGWPSDLMRSVNIGGEWKNHHNRKVWVSRKRCMLKTYLDNSFKDGNTKCGQCTGGKCY